MFSQMGITIKQAFKLHKPFLVSSIMYTSEKGAEDLRPKEIQTLNFRFVDATGVKVLVLRSEIVVHYTWNLAVKTERWMRLVGGNIISYKEYYDLLNRSVELEVLR